MVEGFCGGQLFVEPGSPGDPVHEEDLLRQALCRGVGRRPPPLYPLALLSSVLPRFMGQLSQSVKGKKDRCGDSPVGSGRIHEQAYGAELSIRVRGGGRPARHKDAAGTHLKPAGGRAGTLHPLPTPGPSDGSAPRSHVGNARRKQTPGV